LARNIRLSTAAEIAMDWMRVFYGIRVGAMESREFRTRPVPHWLFCFSETIEGLIQRMYFVVLLPDGKVVEPKFAQRLKLRLPKSDIGPTMNLTAEQVQRAVSPDGGKERQRMESLFHRQYVRIAFPHPGTFDG
jgi:hypothetical protein